MDFWSRLVGGSYARNKPTTAAAANDPQQRLARYKRVYRSVYQICNQPPGSFSAEPHLGQLAVCLERLAAIIREETRAPAPHLCLQYSAAKQLYTVIARAASVCQDERIVRGAVAVLAALIDSEEEDFLSSGPFARSLMRFTGKVVDSAGVVVGVDAETDIIELLFGIAAKIRLQPDILAVWFTSTAKPELEDVFVKEKKSFVGITQKEDFPLCYTLIDRVHHEGRIGDFARTGLLYIFEATGRSFDLEEWVVSSDLPTLMASGLGALYSQLSRELSILHPDANLPPVLAMSDYSTSHPRATAESMFSGRHMAHMTTFLSYLIFWQDVLDHCRSDDVKATLLDHFEILFLQQLLYPSLLQSSDTDGGSSVAVLTYLNAMLEALNHSDLVHMILSYLLAIPETKANDPSTPTKPVRPGMLPRSPTAAKRRQSLMLITALKDEEVRLEPVLFNLVDLIINSVESKSQQTVYSALKLACTILGLRKRFAFGTLLRVEEFKESDLRRTSGALEVEIERYFDLAIGIGGEQGVERAYGDLCDDARDTLEAQTPYRPPPNDIQTAAHHHHHHDSTQLYRLSSRDPLLRCVCALLKTFLTNPVDINLALTQAIISLAICAELRPEQWLAMDPQRYTYPDSESASEAEGNAAWQDSLDAQESQNWRDLQSALRKPAWPADNAPHLWTILRDLQQEVDTMRTSIGAFDTLLGGRKAMLQAAGARDGGTLQTPTRPAVLDTRHRRTAAAASTPRRTSAGAKATNTAARPAIPAPASSGPSTPSSSSFAASSSAATPRAWPATPAAASNRRDVFRPPPPEAPSTTDVLLQTLRFPLPRPAVGAGEGAADVREASLNHVLTNVVMLQEFALEIAAVLQTRAAVLGEREVRFC